MPLSDASIEYAQVVINLGDGADRGARIASRGFLLNADGRRQAGEIIDIGFLQLAKELPRVT